MRKDGYDLHTHSLCSDGDLAPADLVKRAAGRLAGMALTDHDSVAGVPAALAAGAEFGLPVVPGVELTTDCGRYEVHILAYFVDYEQPALRAKLDEVAAGRLERVREIQAKLAAVGYPLAWEQIEEQISGASIGRPHVMRALIAAGQVAQDEADRFFAAYLKKGGPAFVPHQELATEEAVRLALTARGVPVLAHPGRIGTVDMLKDLMDWGLVGMEVRHPSHGPGDVGRFSRMARELGLIPTGGSDYHGGRGFSELGDALTAPAAVAALAERASSSAAQTFLSRLHISNFARE